MKTQKIILSLLVLTTIFFWKIIAHPDEMMYSPVSDVFSTFGDMKYFTSETIRNGELPFWNPYLFSGKPGLANLEYNVFYPLNLLFIIFPSDLVFGYYFMIHIFLTGYFMFIYLAEITKNKFSALFAAITFMLSRYMIGAFFQGHITVITAVTFIPLQLYLIEKIFQKPGYKNSILLGITFALQFLGGHPQWVMYSTYLCTAYAILKLADVKDKKKTTATMLKLAAAACIVFTGLTAVQMLQACELHVHGDRHEGVSYVDSTVFQMPPRNLVGFLMPEFYGSFIDKTFTAGRVFEQAFPYVGVLPVFFAFLAVFICRGRYLKFYLLVFLVSLLISLGDNTPAYKMYYYLVPGAKFFRVPSRLLTFTSLSLSVLCALGLTRVLELQGQKKKEFVKYFSWLFMATVIVLAASSYTVHTGWFEKNKWIWPSIIFYGAVSFAGLGLLYMYSTGKLNANFFMGFALILLLVDVWVTEQSYVMTVDPDLAFGSNSMIDFLEKDDGLFRVVSWGIDFPRRKAVRFGIQKLGGYATSGLYDYNELMAAHGARVFLHAISFDDIPEGGLLRLLNVKYIISPGDVYVNEDFLPRAYIVSRAVFMKEREEILRRTLEPDFDPAQVVFIEDENPGQVSYDGDYSVEITLWSANTIELKANLSSPGYLVLSEIWYPAWKAYVDGEKVRVYKADYVLRSVYLPAGSHTIVFRYESEWFMLGALISSLSVLALFLFFAKDYFSGREKV